MKQKASKSTKALTTGNACPITNKTDLTENWKGKVIILDAEKSEIAKKMGFSVKGEYAIKVN